MTTVATGASPAFPVARADGSAVACTFPALAPAGGFYYPQDDRADLWLSGRKLDVHGPELPHGWHTTDLWTDCGIKFIDHGIASKKPFLLCLAYNAPHFPLEAPLDEIAKLRGSYKVAPDKLRERRHARQIENASSTRRGRRRPARPW